MLTDHKSLEIEGIGNYYGGLNVLVEKGVPYWYIQDWDDSDCKQEIPPYLYDALIKFNSEQTSKE